MKVTYIEEIKSCHAWRESMYCSKCNEGKYKIHHQLKPETSMCWWIECENCGYESTPALTKYLAITNWRNNV